MNKVVFKGKGLFSCRSLKITKPLMWIYTAYPGTDTHLDFQSRFSAVNSLSCWSILRIVLCLSVILHSDSDYKSQFVHHLNLSSHNTIQYNCKLNISAVIY